MIAAKTDPKTVELSEKARYPVRVQKAIKASQDLTKECRKVYNTILERYAAGYYSGNSDPARPINMIMRGVQILVPYLVSNNPKAMITSDHPKYVPFADTLSRLCNKRMRQMALWRVLRKAVYGSLWSMGITKSGLDSHDEIHYNGERFPEAKMFCDIVDFEDFVFDPTARCVEEAEFLGNGYLIAMDELKDSGEFKNYDKVVAVNKLWGDESPENISKTIQDFKFRELHEYAYVYDVWLPEKKIIATVPKDGEGKKYMKVVEWDGPDTGPYDILGYNFFPNSILPIPPIFSWLDQDEQLNKMARKMFRQSSREKTVLAFDSTAEDDAQRVVGSGDGDTVRVESVDRLKEIKFGGANADMWPVLQWLRAQISEQAGNLDTLGGMGTSAKTLGQEQMVAGNASKVIDDWSWQGHYFAASIMKKLAHYEWTDPALQDYVVKQVGPVDLPVELSHEDFEGNETDYYFDVQPYSMQRISPEERYQKTLQWVGQIVLPTLQIGAQQGAVLNVTELAKRTAEYLDIDVNGLYNTASPQSASPDAYQPMGGAQVRRPNTGQGDDRIGSGGANVQSNLNQQQAGAFQQPSPPQK